MKIRTKIFLLTVFFALLGGAVGFVSTNYFIRNIFISLISKNGVSLISSQIDSVDRIIYRRHERWASYAQQFNQGLISALDLSNRQFGKIDNLSTFFAEKDKLWQSSTPNPFIQATIDSPLSQELRNRMDFYNNLYGYDIFPEAFLTNKYGALIASTGRTTDYNQSDEDWWQKTVQKSFFIGDVSYDESSDSNSLILGLKINNANDDFLGVLKVSYNIEDILSIIDEIKADSEFKSFDLYLLSSDGQLLYSTTKNLDSSEFLAITKDFLVSNLSQQPPIKIAYLNGTQKIFFSAHSRGYRYFSGLGWSLVSSYNTSEIFSLLSVLNYNNFIAVILIVLFAFLLLIFINRYVLKPLNKLREDALVIKKGDLEHHSEIRTRDEIGELASVFNLMVDSLGEARSHIEQKVEEQTKELKDQKSAILNILEDTEEKRKRIEILADELQRFQLAVTEASDHIVITDSEGIIIYANKAVEKITGFSPAEIIGKKAGNKELWGGLMSHEFYVNLWQTIKIEKKSIIIEINNKKKTGELYTVLASITPIVDNLTGQVEFFIGIERDITKEKMIDKAKTEFVSLASHQLRTPLSTIRWYVEMFLSGDMGKVNEKQRQYIEEIDNANKRMIDLVNALLNTSRLELGTFVTEPEPLNLKRAAEQALAELQEKIQKKKLLIKDDSDSHIPIASLDPRLTHIIFQNLLSNAIKYTLPGGSITWAIKMSDPALARFSKDKKYVLIKVVDTGVGIPPEAVDKIYEKLYRADNARSIDPDGTGLGLYLTKSIVDNAGGQIWFETELNKGTTFYVTLPFIGAKEENA